jgi:uncharacterized protein YkwD
MLKSRIFSGILDTIVVLVVSVLAVGCSTTSSTLPSTTAPTSPSTSSAASTSVTETSTTAQPSTTTLPTSATSPVSPTVSTTPSASSREPPFPTVVYAPTAAPYKPAGTQAELFSFALQLINKDRADQNLSPVDLGYNAAAQKHAQDMLDNNYLAHWGTDGLKPYMRYTLEGGFNYEQENSAFSSSSAKIDPKTEIQALEQAMVYDDAASNWGHRDNIWNKLHKKVNIGLAYNNTSLALVQQFEGDYVEFYQPPTITGSLLSFSGHFKMAGLTLNNAALTFDNSPQPLTAAQLTAGLYHSYGQGPVLGIIFPPLPPNAQYSNLPAGSVIASKGLVKDTVFWLEADVSSILSNGSGVYTVNLVAVLNGQATSFTNYSIIVK